MTGDVQFKESFSIHIEMLSSEYFILCACEHHLSTSYYNHIYKYYSHTTHILLAVGLKVSYLAAIYRNITPRISQT